MNVWDDNNFLADMEELRAKRRKVSGRLSFDCLNLKSKDDRVYCLLGKKLGQAEDGSLPLVTVLKGITSAVCKTCKDFNGEETPLGEYTEEV